MQKIFFKIALFFLFFHVPLAADTLFERLERDGFSPKTQSLVSSGGEFFPENILLDFLGEDGKISLIIDIEKESALDFYDDGTKILLDSLSAANLKTGVTVLFAANDKKPPVKEMSPNLLQCGTSAFLSRLDTSDGVSVLLVDFGDENALVAGSDEKIAPFSLVKDISDSFYKNGLHLKMPHLFFPIYRLGLAKKNERLSLFLQNEIPAVSLIICANTPEIAAIIDFVSAEKRSDVQWNSHYISLQVKEYRFWITEKIFANVLIFIVAVALFLLCEVSFLFGTDSYKRRTAFFKTFAFIPVTIAVTFGAIEISQFIVGKIIAYKDLSIPRIIGIKMLLTFVITSLFYIIQSRIFIISFSEKSFPYLIDTVEILNICIFSSIDVSFVLLFGLEYFLTYISRTLRSMVPLIVSIALMILPFIPYSIESLRFIPPENLYSVAICSPFSNLLFCMVLLPFVFMWVRILIRKKKIILKFAFVLLVFSALLIFALALATEKFQERYFRVKTETNEMILAESKTADHIRAEITETEFLGMYTKHLRIFSDFPVLRYEISANSLEGSPVYDCSFEFEIRHNAHSAYFLLPDNPAQDFLLDYSADNTSTTVITITAWLKTDDNTVTKETVKRSTNEKNDDSTAKKSGDSV